MRFLYPRQIQCNIGCSRASALSLIRTQRRFEPLVARTKVDIAGATSYHGFRSRVAQCYFTTNVSKPADWQDSKRATSSSGERQDPHGRTEPLPTYFNPQTQKEHRSQWSRVMGAMTSTVRITFWTCFVIGFVTEEASRASPEEQLQTMEVEIERVSKEIADVQARGGDPNDITENKAYHSLARIAAVFIVFHDLGATCGRYYLEALASFTTPLTIQATELMYERLVHTKRMDTQQLMDMAVALEVYTNKDYKDLLEQDMESLNRKYDSIQDGLPTGDFDSKLAEEYKTQIIDKEAESVIAEQDRSEP